MEFIFGQEKIFFDFISNISEKDRVGIVSHCDLDGLGSAVLISKAIGKIDYLRMTSYSFNMFDEIYEEIKKNKINKLIFADINVGELEKEFRKLEKLADILIIDHHKQEKDLNSEKTVFMRAETRYPASYMCYYLLSKITKLPSWIAALGIISDMPHLYNKDNAGNVFKDFNMPGEGNLYKETMMASYALICMKDNVERAYKLFTGAKNIEDIRILEKYAGKIKEEIEYYKKDFEKKKEEYGSLLYYCFKSEHNIKPLLNNALSLENPNKTIIILEGDGEKLKFELSARRQDKKIDCAKLLQDSIKGLKEASAGGHIPAAGGEILKKDLKVFKESLIRIHKELERSY